MSALTFHVTLGDLKKRVVSSIDELKSKIAEIFGIAAGQEFRLQEWDDDFSDWLDVDNIETLAEKEKCKLQVILR